MGNNGAPGLTTYLGKILAAGRKLASLSQVQGLLRMIPALPAAALAGVVIMFFLWSCEHQAHQRDLAEAKQAKKQAAEQISHLEQQAAGALQDAKQSTQAVRKLEAQRQQLAREAEGLRQSLTSLRQQEVARVSEVATLPPSEVASRVASRLQEQVTRNSEQGAGQEPLNTLTRPATAGENAVAGHPLPQGGEGESSSAAQGQSKSGGQGQSNPLGESQKSPAALVLSEQEVRKVETALIELDSCRQQTQVMGQQVSNCAQQAKLDSALEQQQSATIAKLNAALADKDQIMARSAQEHRAELKAARGSFRSRFFRAVEIFAGGFIAGVLVR